MNPPDNLQVEPKTELELLKAILECLDRMEHVQCEIAASLNSINEFGVTTRDQR